MRAIDVYFFLNFGFDFLLLQTVVLLMRGRRRWLLLLTGAAIGAFWSCASLFLGKSHPVWDKIITYLLCPTVMYLTVNGKEHVNMREIITGVGCFYFVACAGSGLMNLFYCIFFGDTKKRGFVLIAVMAGMQLLIIFLVYLNKRENERKTLFYKVTLCLKKNKWETVGIWDTGNRLRSVTGKPVHLIDQIGLKAFLGEEAVRQIQNMQEGKLQEGQEFLRLQPVCCSGIGKGDDIIFAFEADEIIILKNGRKIISEKALIGVSKTLFCKEKGYQLILNTGER